MSRSPSIFLLIVILVFPLSLTAGSVSGRVQDANSMKALADVLVRVQGTDFSAVTNSDGRYRIDDLPEKDYYLIFSLKNYYSIILPDVKIVSGTNTDLVTEMVPGDETQYLFMEIGGIQVTADRELLSGDPETVHKITSGEIEHMQANSLANVLSLIPGNVQTVTPGLQRQQMITLRTFSNEADDQAALFGTRIIVDDIPLSNNADLQTGVGVGYGTSVQTTANTEYDLRNVVAENIEKVEVMASGSPVEYGDNSQGVILAKTRWRNIPTRLKLKNNPDTREANLMGSFRAFDTDIAYNVNYGYSERSIRITGDEYHRIATDWKAHNLFLNDQLDVLQIFRYNRKIEEDNDDSDPYAVKAYNRDHNFTYSHQFDYKINPVTSLYLRNYFDYKIRNSWKRKLETPDILLWTDRLTPGTREGIVPDYPTYFSEVSTKGEEWSYGSKLRLKRDILFGTTLHQLIAGAEFQVDANYGAGKMYDLLRPPNGRTSERPRSYSEVPAATQVALFAEDRITGELGLPYVFNFGFRLDSYNPDGFHLGGNGDIFGARQGTFFNPQAGLKIKLTPKTQMRLVYGKSSKMPSISMIYPSPYFLDVNDKSYRIVTDSLGNQFVEDVELISSYRYDISAENLKGYQSTKYEIGLDHKFSDIAISLNAYLNVTTGIPYVIEWPFEYSRYFWLDWPDSTNKLLLETITTVTNDNRPQQNLRRSETSGVEMTITTHRIKPLNMRFRVNAAYTFKKYSSDNYMKFGSVRTFVAGDTLPDGNIAAVDTKIIPWYSPTGKWHQQFALNYHIDYIAKPLGIWFTLKAQHVLFDQNVDVTGADPSAIGYYQEGELYRISPATSREYNLDRSYQAESLITDKSRPNDQWMLSLVISKSLYKGAEFSFFVENIFNDRAWYVSNAGLWQTRNHEIFWGIAFSTKLDGVFQ